MEFMGLILEATLFVVGAIWSTVVWIFWIVIALVAATFIAFLFRRRSLNTPQPVDPVRAVREALHRGELDADIARVQHRNVQRGRLQ